MALKKKVTPLVTAASFGGKASMTFAKKSTAAILFTPTLGK